MITLLKIAFRNVFLHWRQSLAAVISLAAGLVSIVMFQGYMDDVKRMYVETFRSRMMFGEVIIEHEKLREAAGRAEPWNFGMKPDEVKNVREVLAPYSDQFVGFTRFLRLNGVITNGKSSPIFLGYGYDVEEGQKTRGKEWAWNTLYGQPLSPEKKDGIVLGQLLARYLGCLPVKKETIMDSVAGYKAEIRPFECETSGVQINIVTADGQLNAMDFEVVGLVDALYKDIDDKFINMDIESAQSLMNTEDISYITIKMKEDGPLIEKMIENFNSTMKAQNKPYYMTRWQNHQSGEMYVRTMGLLSIFRNFVMTVIIAIACLSIFNTMMKIVKERVREIGTLQSLGFVSKQILLIFIGEAVFMSFMGGAIGSLFAVLSTLLVNSLGIVYKAGILVEPVPLRIMINADLYVISFVLLSSIAAATAWLICRSSVKNKPATNLSFT